MTTKGSLHHLEIWVSDLDSALVSWGWLLPRLGWQPEDSWPAGRSWRLGDTCLVAESDCSGQAEPGSL